MIKNCRIFDYLLITLSIISIIYFIILVINSRFITAYFIYPIFSIITGFYSFYELRNKVSILSNLPKGINYSIKAILILGISIFVVIESLIIYESNNKYNHECDYVIVLGARLNGSSPSPLLRYRLEAALQYHQKFPNTKIIVSGGQGDGEDISEAKAMKDYLVEKGIDESLIITEDKSTNTNENIIYSKEIIEEKTNKDYDVVIITNGFHCFRSKLLANKHNLTAHTYAAKERDDTAPHYYLREFFGCLKDILLS